MRIDDRNSKKSLVFVIIIVIVVLDLWVWWSVIFVSNIDRPTFYALDVGQGDATLIAFPGGVHILTDAGPDKKVLSALDRTMDGKKYIDIAVITHPQLDHFNGFNGILENYKIGAVIINGRSGDGVPEWEQLIQAIQKQNIPLLVLGAKDKITYGENKIDFLLPDKTWRESGELNDTGLVALVNTPAWNALLTADIGINVEEYLIEQNLLSRVDILKVGHHGSKFSTGDAFLEALKPRVATISDGANNRYGHPTKEVLERLKAHDVRVFRTDEHGTIEIKMDPTSKTLQVFSL